MARLSTIATFMCGPPLLCGLLYLCSFALSRPVLISGLGVAYGAGSIAMMYFTGPSKGPSNSSRSSKPDKTSVLTFYLLAVGMVILSGYLLHHAWMYYRELRLVPRSFRDPHV